MVKPVIVDEFQKLVDIVRENSWDITFDESFSGPGAPFYMYGHPREIANNLLDFDQDPVNKYKKYPLFALRLDIPEHYSGGMIEYDLNFAIIDYTKPEYTAAERQEHVFKPILYPLLEKFWEALRMGGWMWDPQEELPEHDKADRYYWGIETRKQFMKFSNANEGLILNDPIDAIEVWNLRIKKDVC